MEFKEVKINNRIEIEIENNDAALRNLRGVVLAVDKDSLALVTDYGELFEVDKDTILSITSITTAKLVSDAIVDLKNHFAEIYELEMKLKLLREDKLSLQQNLFDANFLSKFNVRGAKNRLEKSIDSSLMAFKRDIMSYQVKFNYNPNNEVELIVQVSNEIEHPNLDEVREVDKIFRSYAPNLKETLIKCFPFSSEPIEIEKNVFHEKESLYSVRIDYKMNVDVNKDNFLEMRKSISRGLVQLQKY